MYERDLCGTQYEAKKEEHMRVHLNTCVLELVVGDITEQDTDAIVNAANRWLAGGGGVDGAIHRAGGPGIMAETQQKYPQGCPTGGAVITAAGNLRARHVIHAVGPIWSGGQEGEEELLASAYRRSLEIAVENACQSIAFPSLSTGAYGYPLSLAAPTALRTVKDFLKQQRQLSLVRFVLFDHRTYDIFTTALQQHGQ
jgi:O-acetyl-ADP-ribose deacetylase